VFDIARSFFVKGSPLVTFGAEQSGAALGANRGRISASLVGFSFLGLAQADLS
jgi:hypothetical protein